MRKSLVCGPARAESPTSPQPRATPWVPYPHSLRPVRAKVKANHSPILLPLQGVGVYTLIPRALPWALDWLPFQGARGGRSSRPIHPPHFAREVRGEALRRSTVAHFACKVRGAKVAAIARAENPTRSCPKALAIFATCSSPSLCEQSELQCFAPVPRRPRNSLNSLLRRPRPSIKFVVMRRPKYITLSRPNPFLQLFATPRRIFLKIP